MKKFFKKLTCFCICFLTAINLKIIVNAEDDKEQLYKINTKRDLLVLMLSYSEYVKTIEKNDKDFIYLVMKNGDKILYDDKIKKSQDEKLNNPDLQDMLEQIYPLEQIKEVEPDNFDPGRIRVYSLLHSVYGGGKEDIIKKLTNAQTKYGSFQFNKENNAANNLKKAFDEIANVAKQNPKVLEFVAPINGTFNYRVISGTSRLSAHAFGIAIDLKRNDNDYWKWVSKEKGSKRIASYPNEVVKVFENHGFIWGGKWSHFDILHYEYRPEIILKAKYFGAEKQKEFKTWHDGTPNTEEVKEIIKLIDDNV